MFLLSSVALIKGNASSNNYGIDFIAISDDV